MGKPVICQVHGYCLGGACELMMPADYVIASEDCQLGEPQIQFGAASVFLMAALADKLIKMPPEIIAIQKWGINRQFEGMGIRTGLTTWVDYSMFFRYMTTPEIEEFSRISAEKGVKAALKWRDEYFAAKTEE